jgi:hypothetical protein
VFGDEMTWKINKAGGLTIMKDKWRKIGGYCLVFALGVIISSGYFYWLMNKSREYWHMTLVSGAWTDLVAMRFFQEGKSETAIKVLDTKLDSNTILLSYMKESDLDNSSIQAFIALLVEYREKYPRHPLEEPYETRTGKEIDKFLDKYKDLHYGDPKTCPKQ